MNIPPPARSSMQRTSNRVAQQVTQLNEHDMAEKVQLVKDVNKKRGHAEAEINIAMDGRYNSTTIVSRRKPGQNASQAIGLACETMTDRKYIVAACFQNKLCWTGAWLKGQGIDVTCPGGHTDCTANLSPYAPLSEFAMGKHIGDQLSLQGVLIKYVTTDGDSRSASGVDAALKVLHPMWEVKRLADPGHLGQSQFRRCQRATFSDAMFCCKTRERTRKAHTVFSQDVKARCSLVLKKMMETFAGDLTALKKELPRVLTATIKCYAGDCSNCARYSVVCSGSVNSSWWTRSMFLGTNKISVLNMNESDEHLLQEILKMKLSVEMVDRMKLYTDTQKCEAANRSLSVSLPKNVNYSRNMIGRASSTIHRLNNGPGTSTMSKFAKMGVELCTRVRRSLRQMDAESEYQKQYQKMPAVAKRKLIQHGGRISDLLEYRRKHDSNSDYQKGQLDGVPFHNEHSYS
jgi:hypothetical protein